jgi:hypothetical protein
MYACESAAMRPIRAARASRPALAKVGSPAGTALIRLFEAIQLDDAALARRLDEAVDPGLAAFSLAF